MRNVHTPASASYHSVTSKRHRYFTGDKAHSRNGTGSVIFIACLQRGGAAHTQPAAAHTQHTPHNHTHPNQTHHKASSVMKQSLGARPLAVPTPLFLVGTYDKANRPNIMAVAWAGICCSQPPCLAVSLRKNRWTYNAIREREAFTISIPSRQYVAHADYTGIFSGEEENKFEALGLTPTPGEHVDAPYVEEFPMVLELKLLQTVDIGLHTQFIGEIMDVKIDQSCLREDGLPDLASIDPVLFVPGAREYHSVGTFLARAFSAGKALRR